MRSFGLSVNQPTNVERVHTEEKKRREIKGEEEKKTEEKQERKKETNFKEQDLEHTARTAGLDKEKQEETKTGVICKEQRA